MRRLSRGDIGDVVDSIDDFHFNNTSKSNESTMMHNSLVYPSQAGAYQSNLPRKEIGILIAEISTVDMRSRRKQKFYAQAILKLIAITDLASFVKIRPLKRSLPDDEDARH